MCIACLKSKFLCVCVCLHMVVCLYVRYDMSVQVYVLYVYICVSVCVCSVCVCVRVCVHILCRCIFCEFVKMKIYDETKDINITNLEILWYVQSMHQFPPDFCTVTDQGQLCVKLLPYFR